MRSHPAIRAIPLNSRPDDIDDADDVDDVGDIACGGIDITVGDAVTIAGDTDATGDGTGPGDPRIGAKLYMSNAGRRRW